MQIVSDSMKCQIRLFSDLFVVCWISQEDGKKVEIMQFAPDFRCLLQD